MLTERLQMHAARSPDAPALIAHDGLLSYRDLVAQATRLARHLHHLGVTPGSFVGLSLPLGRAAIIGFWAILEAGGVVVPLDPTYPRERLAFMQRDATIRVIISAAEWVAQLPSGDAILLLVDGDGRVPGEIAPPPASVAAAPTPFACCLYTSGSTGQPKGVLIEQHALLEHCDAIQTCYQTTPADRVLLFASLNYVAALEQLLVPLLTGGTVVLREPQLWSALEFPAKVRHYGLTIVDLPPSYLQTLLATWVVYPDLVRDLPLRMIILGGEATTPTLVQQWCQTPLRTIPLLNAYGMTETPVTATLYTIPADPERVWTRIPIGQPIPQRHAYLLAAQQQRVAAGEVGELAIGGIGLAHSYLNQPELTAEKFIANPFGEGRLYRTGDLARWLPDGNLEYLGRADAQVQIRGHRVELGEVEAALRHHPSVAQAVVVAREVGEAQELVALVVPHTGVVHAGETNDVEAPSDLAQALLAFLRTRLPGQMVPAWVHLVATLPQLPNGKLDRRGVADLLQELFPAPAPASHRAVPDGATALGGLEGVPFSERLTRELVAATSDQERRQRLEAWLRQELHQVLGPSEAQGLEARTRFMDVGVDSLVAVELRNRLMASLGRTLHTTLLFDYPTLEALAAYLLTLLAPVAPAVPPAEKPELRRAPTATPAEPRTTDELIAFINREFEEQD